MRNFLNGKVMAGIWMVLRIWLGVQWLQAGWGKITGGFDAGGYLNGAIGKSRRRSTYRSGMVWRIP